MYSHQLSAGPWLTRVALGLQLGGATGNNLVDRLRQGYVVDFIDLNFWPMREWPVFNLADTSIVTGVTVLALLMVREEWLAWKNRQAAQDDG
jgi:signal peptidase II